MVGPANASTASRLTSSRSAINVGARVLHCGAPECSDIRTSRTRSGIPRAAAYCVFAGSRAAWEIGQHTELRGRSVWVDGRPRSPGCVQAFATTHLGNDAWTALRSPTLSSATVLAGPHGSLGRRPSCPHVGACGTTVSSQSEELPLYDGNLLTTLVGTDARTYRCRLPRSINWWSTACRSIPRASSLDSDHAAAFPMAPAPFHEARPSHEFAVSGSRSPLPPRPGNSDGVRSSGCSDPDATKHRTKGGCRRDARRGGVKEHRANSDRQCGLAEHGGIPTCAANGYLCLGRRTLVFADPASHTAFRLPSPRSAD